MASPKSVLDFELEVSGVKVFQCWLGLGGCSFAAADFSLIAIASITKLPKIIEE